MFDVYEDFREKVLESCWICRGTPFFDQHIKTCLKYEHSYSPVPDASGVATISRLLKNIGLFCKSAQ